MSPYLRPWAILLLVAGCASSTRSEPETPPTLPPSVDSAAAAPASAPKRAVPEGALRREDVLAVLSDGVPTFLQKIEVEAALDREGHFSGWRVVTIRDPELAAGDVRTGDVVRKVNGLPIENPFQFFDAFQSLAFAPELKLSIERGSEHKDLAYPINDDPSAPPMPRPVNTAPSARPSADAPAGEVPSEPKSEPRPEKKKGKKNKKKLLAACGASWPPGLGGPKPGKVAVK